MKKFSVSFLTFSLFCITIIESRLFYILYKKFSKFYTKGEMGNEIL